MLHSLSSKFSQKHPFCEWFLWLDMSGSRKDRNQEEWTVIMDNHSRLASMLTLKQTAFICMFKIYGKRPITKGFSLYFFRNKDFFGGRFFMKALIIGWGEHAHIIWPIWHALPINYLEWNDSMYETERVAFEDLFWLVITIGHNANNSSSNKLFDIKLTYINYFWHLHRHFHHNMLYKYYKFVFSPYSDFFYPWPIFRK